MYQHLAMLSIMNDVIAIIMVLIAVLVILKYVVKLKWLTSLCCAVIAAALPVILGIVSGYLPAANLIILSTAAICALILIIKFIFWSCRGSSESDVNAQERARILKMVEEQKISIEESAELLEAIGRSTALRGEEKFSRQDIVILTGSAMVILGFFLPWASFGNLYQSGNNVGAIGWAILIAGILSVIPIFVTPKNMLYKISMLQIFLVIVGLVLTISILIRVGESLGVGLIFAIAGFTIELIACFAKFKKLAA